MKIKPRKNEYEATLLKEVENGTATDTVITALINYQIDMIAKKRRTINEVPEILRKTVDDKMHLKG